MKNQKIIEGEYKYTLQFHFTLPPAPSASNPLQAIATRDSPAVFLLVVASRIEGIFLHKPYTKPKQHGVKKPRIAARLDFIGAANRIRTDDLPLTRRLLYQLSYGGDTGGSGEIRTRDQRIKSPLLYRLSYRPLCKGARIIRNQPVLSTQNSAPAGCSSYTPR